MAALTLALRTLHVLGMVVLLGGALAVWVAARTADPRRYATQYEWAFWGVLGVMVVTGVGNLGALGAPGPDTRWGAVFGAKLAVVIAFVLGSLVRTLAVSTLDGPDAGRFYRVAYGTTAAALVGLVVLAEVLAHG